jgi:hypothetical protein
VLVNVGVAVNVGVGVAVRVGVNVGVGVLVGVGVAVKVGVGVGVTPGALIAFQVLEHKPAGQFISTVAILSGASMLNPSSSCCCVTGEIPLPLLPDASTRVPSLNVL